MLGRTAMPDERQEAKRLLMIVGLAMAVLGVCFGLCVGLVLYGSSTSTPIVTALLGFAFAVTILNFILRARKLS
jgi:CHASE2 domain-containing sensor protein